MGPSPNPSSSPEQGKCPWVFLYHYIPLQFLYHVEQNFWNGATCPNFTPTCAILPQPFLDRVFRTACAFLLDRKVNLPHMFSSAQ